MPLLMLPAIAVMDSHRNGILAVVKEFSWAKTRSEPRLSSGNFDFCKQKTR